MEMLLKGSHLALVKEHEAQSNTSTLVSPIADSGVQEIHVSEQLSCLYSSYR